LVSADLGCELDSVSILTVVFDEEIDLLALQAKSIARFFDSQSIDEIIIIVNGKQQSYVEQCVRQDVLPEYGDLSAKVTLIPADDLYRFRHPEAGWHTQMALKLLAAPRVSSTWYLVLDAKNHFIRSTTVGDFFSKSGRGLYPPDNFGSLQEHFVNAAKLFGVEPEGLIDSFFSPVTPSILHRQSVLDLNEAVVRMTGKSIGDLIVQFDVPYTEFILYSLYLYSVDGFDALYQPSPSITTTIWKENAMDSGSFERKMTQARSMTTLCFSVHRLAREVLTSEQRQQIADLWLDAGLIDDIGSAHKFLPTERPTCRGAWMRMALEVFAGTGNTQAANRAHPSKRPDRLK
jgi:uncharacterized protein DUF6492